MKEWTPCFICGCTATEMHHVYGGANRKHSDKFGLVMPLCRNCHAELHRNRALWNVYKAAFQQKFEKEYSHEYFMSVFGRSYLDIV